LLAALSCYVPYHLLLAQRRGHAARDNATSKLHHQYFIRQTAAAPSSMLNEKLVTSHFASHNHLTLLQRPNPCRLHRWARQQRHRLQHFESLATPTPSAGTALFAQRSDGLLFA
jgi:hypothetical protein